MVTKFAHIIIYFCFFISMTKVSAQSSIWTIGTARTIEKREVQLNMFYFSMFGLTNRLELQAKPLSFVAMPVVNLKKTWYYHKAQKNVIYIKSRNLIIGTIHGINYPSTALKIAKYTQYKNIVPLLTPIPNILAFRNELLISTILKNQTSCDPANLLLTITIGSKLAIKDRTDSFPLPKNPILFREMSIYNQKHLWYVGIGLDGRFIGELNFSLDFDYKSIGNNSDFEAYEHNLLLYWQTGKRKRLRLAFGYKATATNFPNQQNAIMPLIDFTYMFKRTDANARDLFEKGVYDPFEDRESEYKDEEKNQKKELRKNKKENRKKNK